MLGVHLVLTSLLILSAINRGQSMQFISYHLFSFRGSVQDYKIHMDMEVVKFT